MKEVTKNFCPLSDLPRDSPRIDLTKRSLNAAAVEQPHQRRATRRAERPRARYHTVPVTFDELKEVDEDEYLRNERLAVDTTSRSTPSSINDFLYSDMSKPPEETRKK